MGTDCAPLLADLFLYSCGAEFVRGLLHGKRRSLVVTFGSAFRCIDDVLSINNYQFRPRVDLIYPSGLEIKDTTESVASASCLDVLLRLDTGGGMAARLCGRRGGFSFSIVGFPCLCGGIPASPACGVCVWRLVRCARACSTCSQFLVRGGMLTDGLVSRGFRLSRLRAAFRGFCGRCSDLICSYNLSLGHMLPDMFHTNR
jgi:hypothetical protein